MACEGSSLTGHGIKYPARSIHFAAQSRCGGLDSERDWCTLGGDGHIRFAWCDLPRNPSAPGRRKWGAPRLEKVAGLERPWAPYAGTGIPAGNGCPSRGSRVRLPGQRCTAWRRTLRRKVGNPSQGLCDRPKGKDAGRRGRNGGSGGGAGPSAPCAGASASTPGRVLVGGRTAGPQGRERKNHGRVQRLVPTGGNVGGRSKPHLERTSGAGRVPGQVVGDVDAASVRDHPGSSGRGTIPDHYRAK